MRRPQHPTAGDDREQLLKTLLRRSWHVPVLRALADGPTRYADIGRKVRVAERGRRLRDGTLSTILNSLADLGLAEKPDVSHRPAWQATTQGRTALHDLETFERLGKGEIDPRKPCDSSTRSADTPTMTRSCRKVAGDTMVDRRAALMVQPQGEIDVTVAHPARRYNYWLGGNDNFKADRDSADHIEKVVPGMRAGILENRRVHGRIVQHLAAEQGIRQFLDIGSGLPALNNTHEVAQSVNLSSSVVYVDNDPLVMAHAQALLTGAPEGQTAYLQADLREPAKILNSPITRIAFDQAHPVAVLLTAVLHFIPESGAAKPLVDQLMGPLPSGSFLAITHATLDFHPPELAAQLMEMHRDGRFDIWPRPREELLELFDGLEIVSPGVVLNTHWRPAPDTPDLDLHLVGSWAGVGRKR